MRARMSITAEEIKREKKRLPRGWGRFGKTLDRLAAISEPDESLLSSCVGLNPSFKHKTRTLPGGLYEMTKTTNIVLASTSARLILIGTGFGGAPRDDYSIAYDGLEVVSHAEKEFVMRWPEGEMRIRGAAKQQLPGFLDAVSANARPRSPEGERPVPFDT